MGSLIVAAMALVGIMVAWFLLRTAIKFLIIGVLIYVLFHMAFVWSGEETGNALQIERWMQAEQVPQAEEALSAYTEKRDAHAVIDTVEIRDNVELFLNDIRRASEARIKEADYSDIVASLTAQFESLTKEEQQEVAKALQDMNASGK